MSEAATIERKLPPTERIAVKAKDAAALGGAWWHCRMDEKTPRGRSPRA